MINSSQAAKGVIQLFKSCKKGFRKTFYQKTYKFNTIIKQQHKLLYGSARDYHSWKHTQEQSSQNKNIKLLGIFMISLGLSFLFFTLKQNESENYNFWLLFGRPMKYLNKCFVWVDSNEKLLDQFKIQNRYDMNGILSKKLNSVFESVRQQKKLQKDLRSQMLKKQIEQINKKYGNIQ